MNIQDKYKWNAQKLQGQLWARGLSQKVMDLHNDAIEALAIEQGELATASLQQGQDRDLDELWTDLINLEAEYRGLQKELGVIKKDLAEIDKG